MTNMPDERITPESIVEVYSKYFETIASSSFDGLQGDSGVPQRAIRTIGDFVAILSQYPPETPLVLDLPACGHCGRDGFVTPNPELIHALPTDVEGRFDEFRPWHGPDTPTVQVLHLSP